MLFKCDCQDCDTEFSVEIDLDEYYPHFCNFCGGDNVKYQKVEKDEK